MSVNVVLKQKIFGNKTIPLEIILGDNLTFGSYGDEGLEVGKITGSEIIIFNSNRMARGFAVDWTRNEKKRVIFSLPLPSTTEEITDFYSSVERVAKYWNAKIEIDGTTTSIEEFKNGLDEMLEMNMNAIKLHAKGIFNGINDSLSFPTVRFPLNVGKEEAEIFVENPEKFAEWLHEKQNTVAAAPEPGFYDWEGKICGYYKVVNGVSLILPNEPKAPFGARNPLTGAPLEIEQWSVVLFVSDEEEPLDEIGYFDFMDRIPDEKVTKFDGDKILISELTKEEIKSLID